MKERQILEMREPIRKIYVDSHKFYVEQAQTRLLSQFNNLEEEADKFGEDWLENTDFDFDPDNDDFSDLEDQAFDESQMFYENLTDLQEQTRFAVTAGMYHKWDKALREWLFQELKYRKSLKREQIWCKDIGKIFELLKGFGWDISLEKDDFYKKLDACRLVINVYKHGNGQSLNYLYEKYPEYIHDPLEGVMKVNETKFTRLDHEFLKLEDKHFIEFAHAITEFWEKVPEVFMEADIVSIPQWLK